MARFMTTLRYTLRGYRGHILGWGLGTAMLGIIIVASYAMFTEQQMDFAAMLENYPPEILQFFGGDAESLMTPEGFLGMYGFSMLPVIVPIFSVIAGSGLFALDEEQGRLDLIISHPVGRSAFFFGRVLAFVLASVGILIISWLGFSILLNSSPMDVSWGEMALAFLPVFAQMLIYGAFALMLSTLLPARSMAGTTAALVMAVSYLISSMASIVPILETIAKGLPYTYFQGVDAINGLNAGWFIGLLGTSAGMTLIAWWRFTRRDIRLSGEGSFTLGALIGKHRESA